MLELKFLFCPKIFRVYIVERSYDFLKNLIVIKILKKRPFYFGTVSDL